MAESVVAHDTGQEERNGPGPEERIFEAGCSTVDLGEVALNDNFVLKRLLIRNLIKRPITIGLSSSAGSQMGFQLTNENLTEDGECCTGQNFNQLFNIVNLINSVDLAPLEERNIIMTYRAKPKDYADTSIYADPGTSFFTVNERIFLHAQGETPGSSTVVHLTARICRSVMKTDLTELDFLECIVGRVYVKDFTVWNKSEMKLTFSVDCPEVGKVFEISEYESGQPIEDMVRVGSYSNRRIRVMYKPVQVGEETYSLDLENINDPDNEISIKLHTVVSPMHTVQADGLKISCGGSLDFGECYTTRTHMRRIKIKNVTQETLDVHFGTEAADEVSFELSTDLEEAKRRDTDGEDGESPARRHGDWGASYDGTTLKHRIDEINLIPGKERSILVNFVPEVAEAKDDAGALSRRTFKINLTCRDRENRKIDDYGKIIHCKARVCTSLVQISRTNIKFGQTEVGQTKNETIQIMNLSQLPAKLAMDLNSKALKLTNLVDMAEPVLEIKPMSSYSLEMSFQPRRINPNYKKQFTIRNLNNPGNDHFIRVRANNIGPDNVSSTGRYFTVETSQAVQAEPAGDNDTSEVSADKVSSAEVNYGTVVSNCPALRMITVKNVTKSSMTFNISVDSEDYQLYKVAGGKSDAKEPTSPAIQEKKEVIPMWEERKTKRRDFRNALKEGLGENTPASSAALNAVSKPRNDRDRRSRARKRLSLDLATPSQKETKVNVRRTPMFGADRLVSKVKVDEAAPALSSQRLHKLVDQMQKTDVLPAFSDLDSEEAYVATFQSYVKEISRALDSGHLVPCSSFELDADGSMMLYIIHKASHKGNTTKLRRVENTLTLELVNYDRSRLEDSVKAGQTVKREIPLVSNVCNSEMSLSQKSIKFEQMVSNETRNMTLVLNNHSEAPLIYDIAKTGTVASGAITFQNGRQGCVRPFGTKDIHFSFKPTIAGNFNEKLIFDNLADSTGRQELKVKADVTKAENFFTNITNLDFGSLIVGEKSKAGRISVTNTSNSTRSFEVNLNLAVAMVTQNYVAEFDFDLEEGGRKAMGETEREEEIERLEWKLKIYERKGKTAKIPKTRKMIELLRSGADLPAEPEVESESETEGPPKKKKTKLEMKRTGRSSILISIPAKGTQGILIYCKPIINVASPAAKLSPCQYVEGIISINEKNNRDVVKTVEFSVVVCRDNEAKEEVTKGLIEVRRAEVTSPQSPSSSFDTSRRVVVPSGSQEQADMHASGLSVQTDSESMSMNVLGGGVLASPLPLRSSPGNSTGAHDSPEVMAAPPAGAIAMLSEPSLVEGSYETLFTVTSGKKAAKSSTGNTPTDGYCAILNLESNIQDRSTLSNEMTIASVTDEDLWLDICNTSSNMEGEGSVEMELMAFSVQEMAPGSASGRLSFGNSGLRVFLPSRQTVLVTVTVTDKRKLSDVTSTPAEEEFAEEMTGSITIVPLNYPPLRRAVLVKARAFLPVLSIDPSHINFPAVVVREKQHGTFVIKNRSKSDVTYVILAGMSAKKDGVAKRSELSFTPSNGIVPGKSEVSVALSCSALVPGRLSETVAIRNLSNLHNHKLVISFSAQNPDLLRFLDADDKGEIDFGACYAVEETARVKVAPLRIQNLQSKPINVTVRSNLSKQVYVHLDENMEQDATNVKIDPNEIMTVFVSLLPHISGAYFSGKCKEIVGGIRAKVSGSESVSEQQLSVRFKSTVGMSILKVSPSRVDLGVSKVIGSSHMGSFVISNITDMLPSDFIIEAPDNITLSQKEGILDIAGNGTTSECEIRFTMKTTDYGYTHEVLTIRSKQNKREVKYVNLHIFVDEGSVRIAQLDKDGGEVADGDADHKLVLDDVYISPANSVVSDTNGEDSAGYFFSSEVKSLSRPLLVTNMTDKPFIVRSKCDHSWLCARADGKGPGEPFELKPQEGKMVHIEFGEKMASLSTDKHERIVKKKHIKLASKLLLLRQDEGNQDGRTVTMIRVETVYHLSTITVSPLNVDLGQIGTTNSWEAVPFSFKVKNDTDTKVRYEVIPPASGIISIRNVKERSKSTKAEKMDLVEENSKRAYSVVSSLSNMSSEPSLFSCEYSIEAGTTHILHGTFRPELLEKFTKSETFFSEILLRNAALPANVVSVSVKAFVTIPILEFGDLNSNGMVTLPPMTIPSSKSARASISEFTITNISDNSVTARGMIELDDDMEGLIDLTGIDNQKEITLAPGASQVVQISGQSSSTEIPNADIFNGDVVLGKIYFDMSPLPAASVGIAGTFNRGHTFSLSTTKLSFHNIISRRTAHDGPGNDEEHPNDFGSASDRFFIKNMATMPLEFETETVERQDLKARVTVTPSKGHVPPNESLKVSVRVHYDGLMENEAISIIVKDVRAPSLTENVVAHLSCKSAATRPVEGVADNLVANVDEVTVGKDRLKVARANSETSLLGIRGCTPMANSPNRFELDIGQQNYRSGWVDWDLTLVNLRPTPVHYKLYTISRSDLEWLEVSRSNGVLDDNGDEETVTLKLNTDLMLNRSTYLLVENVENPSDLKTVRVNMEVVGTQKELADENLFSVLVDGNILNETVIDMGIIYYNRMYVNRSFIIHNSSDVPMEFLLGSNLNVNFDDGSEMHFSLSNTSLKRCRALTVQPQSSARVFLHFRPVMIDNSVGEGETVPMTIEIYVTSKLVKDYQATVLVHAKCRPPQVEISQGELVFEGRDVRDMAKKLSLQYENTGMFMNVEPTAQTLTIRNLYNEKLEYIVRNDSHFFDVEGAGIPTISRKNVLHMITVTPNLEAINEHLATLKKERYIEEHISIYNKNSLTEVRVISVRFTIGFLRSFFAFPGNRNSLPYSKLEDTIVSFLRSFSSMWEMLLDVHQGKSDSTFRAAVVDKLPEIEEHDTYKKLQYEFHYLTDELVFYGLKGNLGQYAHSLAALLFCAMLRHKVFSSFIADKVPLPSSLSEWPRQLYHFLNFFPEKRDLRMPLHELEVQMRPIITHRHQDARGKGMIAVEGGRPSESARADSTLTDYSSVSNATAASVRTGKRSDDRGVHPLERSYSSFRTHDSSRTHESVDGGHGFY